MVIETDNITKWYGNKLGCADICLSVSEGQVFGFLGHNGAGKSTLVKIMTGLIFPTSGSAKIFGKPLGNRETKKRIGFLPENFRFHEWLSGMELLSFHYDLYRMPRQEKKKRIEELLELVRLKGHENRKIKAYSKGMQQRLGLAAALLPDPDLLILDEPTSALDPLGRKEVRDIILYLKALGKTVFLNSHLLSEVEMVCDHVALIKNGRIIAGGTIDELNGGKTEVKVHVKNLNSNILYAFQQNGLIYRMENDRVIAEVSRREEIPHIVRLVVENGGDLYELQPLHNSLESLFLDLMGKGGESGADNSQDDSARSI